MRLHSENAYVRVAPAATTLALALLLTMSGSRNAAAEGPFTAMAGTWSGPGTITVNGNKEKLRCRASYDVKNAGSTFDLSIRCASDSYKFDLAGGVNYVNGSVSGSWSEFGARRRRHYRRDCERWRDPGQRCGAVFLCAAVDEHEGHHPGDLALVTGQPDLIGYHQSDQGRRSHCRALIRARLTQNFAAALRGRDLFWSPPLR